MSERLNTLVRYLLIPPIVIGSLEATRWLARRLGVWPRVWP